MIVICQLSLTLCSKIRNLLLSTRRTSRFPPKKKKSVAILGSYMAGGKLPSFMRFNPILTMIILLNVMFFPIYGWSEFMESWFIRVANQETMQGSTMDQPTKSPRKQPITQLLLSVRGASHRGKVNAAERYSWTEGARRTLLCNIVWQRRKADKP